MNCKQNNFFVHISWNIWEYSFHIRHNSINHVINGWKFAKLSIANGLALLYNGLARLKDSGQGWKGPPPSSLTEKGLDSVGGHTGQPASAKVYSNLPSALQIGQGKRRKEGKLFGKVKQSDAGTRQKARRPLTGKCRAKEYSQARKDWRIPKARQWACE